MIYNFVTYDRLVLFRPNETMPHKNYLIIRKAFNDYRNILTDSPVSLEKFAALLDKHVSNTNPEKITIIAALENPKYKPVNDGITAFMSVSDERIYPALLQLMEGK